MTDGLASPLPGWMAGSLEAGSNWKAPASPAAPAPRKAPPSSPCRRMARECGVAASHAGPSTRRRWAANSRLPLCSTAFHMAQSTSVGVLLGVNFSSGPLLQDDQPDLVRRSGRHMFSGTHGGQPRNAWTNRHPRRLRVVTQTVRIVAKRKSIKAPGPGAPGQVCYQRASHP